MKTIVLDGARMTDLAAAHAYLKEKLGLPDYYGANLDALYDCLGELPRGVQLVIVNESALLAALGEYGERLLATFRDAAARPAAFLLTEEEQS